MLPERYVGSQDKAAALIYFPSKMSSVGYKVHTLHQILEDEKWNLPIYQPEFQSARLQEAAGPHCGVLKQFRMIMSNYGADCPAYITHSC